MKPRLKAAFSMILKLAIIAAAVVLIANRLDLAQWSEADYWAWHAAEWIIPVVVLLWGLNLYWDALIWQSVHQLLAPVSLLRAFKTNLVSYALAFVTPVNSGELAGRYMMLSPGEARQKTIFLVFWSHFPRLVIKILVGGGALVSLLALQWSHLKWWLLAFSVTSTAAVILIYLYFHRFQKLVAGWGWRQKKLAPYLLPHLPHRAGKLRLLLLALLKYLTYNSQFILLVVMFSGMESTVPFVLAVLAYYLISALVPTLAAADFVVKSALALLVFTDWPQGVLVLSASTIWMINLALPALAGSLLLARLKWQLPAKSSILRGSRYDPAG